MVDEVMKAFGLNSAPLKYQVKIIDATVGAGGHSEHFVKKGVSILGIDQDAEMLEVAEKVLKQACPTTFSSHERGSFKLAHGNFKNIDKIAKENGFSKVDGILFDLGISSYHFDTKTRGFSFSELNAHLDMRLDQKSQAVTAADLLNSLPQKKLQELFAVCVRKDVARKIARKVRLAREEDSIETVRELLSVLKTVGKKPKDRDLHFATLPFLALRIAVNSELENAREGIEKGLELLRNKGKMVVISFHSGEDAIVKHIFRGFESKGKAVVVTKKPIITTEVERLKNPRSRSAKMRIVERK